MATSCGQYRNHPPTMGADPPLTGAEGIALANQLQSAFEIIPFETGAGEESRPSLCTYTLPQHQESESLSYRRYANKGVPKQFICIRYKAHATQDDIRDHIEAGFALTDLYCDIYFRRISQHSNQRRFARGVVNDVGAAITAVLGLAKVASPVTGGFGAGVGLIDSSFRNYDDAFLVAADLSTLQSKVFSEQEQFKTLIEKRTDVTRYTQANSIILRYANYCSYTGMRGLINSSLAETTGGPTAIERMTGYITSAIAAAKTIRAATDASPDNAAAPADNAELINQM